MNKEARDGGKINTRFIYLATYIFIVVVVYLSGLFFDEISKSKLLQFGIFFALAIIADKLLKKMLNADKQSSN